MVDNSPVKTALIAGAGGGIGAAVALRLAGDGLATVLAYHRRRERAEEHAALIRDRGGQADTVALDVLDGASLDEVCRRIFEKEGSLDVLVNCTGINREAAAAGMDDDTWRKVLGVNLDGAFRLARAAAKYMILQRRGRIVTLSSIAASRGGRGQVNYAAGKAGVEAMTRVLALELGRKGVLVNCVAPGIIETEMTARIRRDHGDRLLDAIPMKRFGTAEEVAGLVSFLVSGAAGYVTGQVFRIDGGLSL